MHTFLKCKQSFIDKNIEKSRKTEDCVKKYHLSCHYIDEKGKDIILLL